MRRLALLGLAGAAAYVLPVLLVPANFIQDDSYFYLQVARNVVDGLGSTFHGITPTNGYHPLWLALLVPTLLLTGAEGEAAMRVAFLLQAALGAGAILVFRRLCLRLGWPGWPVGAALLAGFLLSTTLYGSEAHLNALLLAAGAWAALEAMGREGRGPWLAAGALLGLAVLARLDNVFVAGALLAAAAACAPLPWRGRLDRLLAAGAATTAVLAPYLLLNWLEYGHLVPISGAVKSTFPRVAGRLDALGDLGRLTALAGAVSLAAAFLPGVAPLRPLRRAALGGLGAGVLAHAAYVVLFTDHYTFWRWYYVAGVLDLALLASAAPAALAALATRTAGGAPPAWPSRAAAAGAALLVAAGLAYGWLKALDPVAIGPWRLPARVNEYRWPDELGAWMRERLPPGSGVMVYDYPGSLAWHSRLRILPTDGLINDFAWNDEILAAGIEAWLCAKDVRFFLGPMVTERAELGPRGEIEAFPPRDGVRRIAVDAPLYRRPAGEIRVAEDGLVARVPDVVRDAERTPELALWRISASCFA